MRTRLNISDQVFNVMTVVALALILAIAILTAIIFQIHIGSWYGWLVGSFISWGASGMCAAKLKPWLLWHQSVSDSISTLYKPEEDRDHPTEDSAPHSPLESNADRSLPELSLHEKAKEAPSSFRILMEALQGRLEREFIQLKKVTGWQHFVEVSTVAGCVSLALRLHFDVSEEKRTNTELKMREYLSNLFPHSEQLYERCHGFVTDSLLDIPRPERPKHIFVLIAMWVIEGLSDGKELENQNYIVAQLAYLYQNETIGYWLQKS